MCNCSGSRCRHLRETFIIEIHFKVLHINTDSHIVCHLNDAHRMHIAQNSMCWCVWTMVSQSSISHIQTEQYRIWFVSPRSEFVSRSIWDDSIRILLDFSLELLLIESNGYTFLFGQSFFFPIDMIFLDWWFIKTVAHIFPTFRCAVFEIALVSRAMSEQCLVDMNTSIWIISVSHKRST